MNYIINGTAKTFEGSSLNIQELLHALGYAEDQKIAVAVNLEFVPRSAHATHQLAQGDDIEIVAPMQGG
jgi:sulfur carrier protein